MKNSAFILGPNYRKQINEVHKQLSQLKLKDFITMLSFNDGSIFIMSHTDGKLCVNKFDPFTQNIALLINDEDEFPGHKLVRYYSECTFFFSASPPLFKQAMPPRILRKFENFCINFIDYFLDLIITYNPAYRYSFILTNKNLRDAVIKRGYAHQFSFSPREMECLWLAAQGKTAKQIANTLKISPLTVANMLKKIREELQCSTLVEAIMESIHRGIIGKVSFL